MERIIEWEKQFSSVELSKKLKDLEISVNTCFNWVYNKDKNKWSIFANSILSQNLTWDNKLPAYSASELLELFPNKNINFYKVGKVYIFSIMGEPNTEDENLSNSCAKMLIHLLENNLMENK